MKNKTVTLDDIKKIHKLFYQNIDPDNAGTYRKQKVFISGMDVTLPDPEQVEKLMKQFENDLICLKSKLHLLPTLPLSIIINLLSSMVYGSQKEYLRLLKK